MRKWAGGVLILTALFGVSYWYWTLGTITAGHQAGLRMYLLQEPVEMRHGTQEEWKHVTQGQTVMPGDTIRTGATGRATIEQEGGLILRLDASTEVRIDPEAPTSSLRMQLLAGNVWNSMTRSEGDVQEVSLFSQKMRVMARDAVFEMRMTATTTRVNVWNAVIRVEGCATERAASSTGAETLTGNTYIQQDARGRCEKKEMDTQAGQTEWERYNIAADEGALHDAQKRFRAHYEERSLPEPGSLRERWWIGSEWVHRWIERSRAPELTALYSGRRLFAIMRAIESGAVGSAYQAMTACENEIVSQCTGSAGARYRPAMRKELRGFRLLLKEADPNSPLYRLKQRMEETFVKCAEDGEIASAAARLELVATRMEEVETLIKAQKWDAARQALDAEMQNLENIAHDVSATASEKDELDWRLIRREMEDAHARESSLRQKLLHAQSSSEAEKNMATRMELSDAFSTQEAPATTRREGVVKDRSTSARLILRAASATVVVGTSQEIRVWRRNAEGAEIDVTPFAQIKSMDPRKGSMAANVFFASQSTGTVELRAEYAENGVIATGAREMRLTQAATSSNE